MCNLQCSSGRNHSLECEILSRCTAENRPKTLQIDGLKETNAYAIIAPLRLLLLLEANGDEWMRSNQLMDHQKGWYINGTDVFGFSFIRCCCIISFQNEFQMRRSGLGMKNIS